MSTESQRHADQKATREIFAAPFTATAYAQAGNGHYGAQIDHNGDFCAILLHVPHDYSRLINLTVVVAANAGLPSMNFRVVCSYARNKEPYGTYGGTIDYRFASAQQVQEIDVSLSVAGGAGVRTLKAGDYLGLEVSRNAAIIGVNTNLNVLGARLKYR